MATTRTAPATPAHDDTANDTAAIPATDTARTGTPATDLTTSTATNTATGPNGTGGAAGRVWDALTACPDATVSAIASAAGMSVAATRRALTVLEAGGHAIRTPGGRDGGKHTPDTWNATTTTITPATDSATESTDAATPDAPATPDAAPDAAPDGDAAATDGGAGGTGMDAGAVAEAGRALAGLREVIGTAVAALEAGDGAAALSAAEELYGGSATGRRLVRVAAKPRRTANGRTGAQPGELRAKVTAHLAAHPGAEFTPHEIARVIGHSAGAISNALDRLVGLGEAAMTSERPRRFTTATGTTTATSPAPDTASTGSTIAAPATDADAATPEAGVSTDGIATDGTATSAA